MRAIHAVTAVVALAVPVAAGGCVERKMVIRSDPPGALIHLEDEGPVGRTPFEVPFEWDGTRRVTLQAPGHAVLETTAELEAKWYDYFPLDFVAYFLWPGTIHDVREFSYRLEPYVPYEQKPTEAEQAKMREDLDALRARAEVYRAGGSSGPATALPGAAESVPGSGAAPGPVTVPGRTPGPDPVPPPMPSGPREAPSPSQKRPSDTPAPSAPDVPPPPPPRRAK